MKSSFSSRRQARKVGQDDDDEPSSNGSVGQSGQEQGLTSTVIRPSIGSRNGSSKIKKHSSLRMSFGPGGTSMTEDDDETTSAVLTPKKSNLSRQAVEKNALRKTLAANIAADQFPLRQTDNRPSYSNDYLKELKGSTPSTPKNLRSQSDIPSDQETTTFNLASKFGSDLIVQDTHPSAIPTNAEIREKKERRARLAKEQDFISLHDDEDNAEPANSNSDSESNDERSLLPYAQQQQKHATNEETRLVRDDEDIAEGFDAFVSDGRIALGRKAEREQKKRHEAEIRDLINEAEGDESEEDDSEVERNAAYEAAQTRKGMDGLHRSEEEKVKPRRPRTPPRITPLPSLSGVLEGLKGRLAGMEYSLKMKEARMGEIRREREDVAVRKEEVQRLLRETGGRFERLSREAEGGAKVDGSGVREGSGSGTMDGIRGEAVGHIEGIPRRGLETLGEV